LQGAHIYRFFLFFLFFFVCCIVVVGAHTLSLLQVQGSWLSCIEFDGERFWEWNDSKLKIYTPIPVDDPLPSDSRFREDCKYLAKGDLETAGEYVFPMARALSLCVSCGPSRANRACSLSTVGRGRSSRSRGGRLR
jgi:hypothetical protein